MALEYLGFLVALLAFVEEKTLYVVKGGYGLGRSRVPGMCVPLLVKGERTVSTTYSTLRSLFCKHGEDGLHFVEHTVHH